MASSSRIYDGIIRAASCGDLSSLKETRERSGELNFKRMCNSKTNFYGEKVIHYAAKLGHLDMCKFLVEEVGMEVGLDALELDFKTFYGETPLLIAIRKGHPDVARYLIEHGACISTTDTWHCSPLHSVILRYENTDLVELLLGRGANIEVDSVLGKPLHCAVRCGRFEIAEFLLQHGANPNSISEFDGFTPLFNAISSSAVEDARCVQLLLDYGANANQNVHGMSALTFAANSEKLECIKNLMISADRGLTALEYAAYRQSTEAIEALFVRTSRIEQYPEWSPAGVVERMRSNETREMMSNSIRDLIIDLKQEAKNAMGIMEPSRAVELLNKALFYAPSDIQIFYRRSIAWGYMRDRGQEAYALHDARECIKHEYDEVNLAEAHFREGEACTKLKCYSLALDAYKKAWALNPLSNIIGDAYRRTLKDLAGWTVQSDPVTLSLNLDAP